MSEKKYIKGYIGKTNKGLEYEVLDYVNGNIKIKFIDTGYITTVTSSQLISGYIKDKMKPSVCSVGYLGCGDAPNRSKEYVLWKGLIERCYNNKREDYKMYGALGVTVCDRWKCFSNFLEDIKNIEGFDGYKFNKGQLDLDKDVKQSNLPINEKVYSLSTCMFIDKHKNRAITTRKQTENINIISTKDDCILKTSCPVEELAKRLGIKTQYITRILRGEAKTHNGWTFKYF